MNAAGVVKAIQKYHLIVGPYFEPGCKVPQPVIGWSVYREWIAAADDTYNSMSSPKALVTHEHLSFAVHLAVKKIKAGRTARQAKSREGLILSKES